LPEFLLATMLRRRRLGRNALTVCRYEATTIANEDSRRRTADPAFVRAGTERDPNITTMAPLVALRRPTEIAIPAEKIASASRDRESWSLI